MLTAEAQIDTERPSRYLVQLCRHAAAMAGTHGHGFSVHASGDPMVRSEVALHAEWSDTHGSVRFDPWGQCTIQATAYTLMLRVDATDEDNLRRIQDLITSDLARFGRRENLTVTWHRPDAPSLAPGTEPAA